MTRNLLLFVGIFLIAILRVGFVSSKKARECDKALWKLAADLAAKEKDNANTKEKDISEISKAL